MSVLFVFMDIRVGQTLVISFSPVTTQLYRMPKYADRTSAMGNSFDQVRRLFNKGEKVFKFFLYEDKASIIYKLNKFHYLDTKKIVVSLTLIKYFAELAAKENPVQHVSFELCSIEDEGCIEFLKGNWNNIIILDLNSNSLTRRAIEVLIKPSNLGKLKQLELNDNLLDASAGEVLARGTWKQLESILLNFNSLGDQGLKKLSTANWAKLKELHLVGNSIGNSGIEGLIRMKLPLLQKLFLSNNLITADGCKVLARGQWKQLKTLEIDGNIMRDDSMLHLTRLGCYNLGDLRVFGSNTCVMETEMRKQDTTPTMAGLSWLIKGCWSRLRIQATLGKFGPMKKGTFIHSDPIKDMVEQGNVKVVFKVEIK